MGDSVLIRKEPCPACGSRDNLARYSDGHAHCFSMGCDHWEPADDGDYQPEKRNVKMAKGLIDGEYKALGKRKITEETCRKFGYRVGEMGDQPVQIAPYFNKDREEVGQKIRFPNKEFTVLGEVKTAQLFGQHLWGANGKMVVVTEGEIDALSVSQLQDNRWPVVSLINGADSAAKGIAANLDWLNSYEKVILMFDMDEAGKKATATAARLLKPGKAYVASLPLKDANECLVNGQGAAVVAAIWNAKPYRPDGLVRVSDVREKVLVAPTMGLSWFSETLTTLTYGRRFGEIYAFGAGTGIGKTDWLLQQVQHDVNVLGEKVGLFFLEQPPDETIKRVCGKFAKRCFHVPDDGWTQEELVDAVDRLERDDRVVLYDSFGVSDWGTIADGIRFLFHSEGTRIFYLDHLTALAASKDDERKELEKIMAEMAGLVKELGIIIHLVSHLATPEGKPHEEGGRVMIRHFKGSRAIGFWCMFMFGLERDQQHENPEWRGITTFRVLKDRNTGRSSGQCVYFGYEAKTGQLNETQPPEDVQATGFTDQTVNDDL
jgi:twinkle protein